MHRVIAFCDGKELLKQKKKTKNNNCDAAIKINQIAKHDAQLMFEWNCRSAAKQEQRTTASPPLGCSAPRFLSTDSCQHLATAVSECQRQHVTEILAALDICDSQRMQQQQC